MSPSSSSRCSVCTRREGRSGAAPAASPVAGAPASAVSSAVGEGASVTESSRTRGVGVGRAVPGPPGGAGRAGARSARAVPLAARLPLGLLALAGAGLGQVRSPGGRGARLRRAVRSGARAARAVRLEGRPGVLGLLGELLLAL